MLVSQGEVFRVEKDSSKSKSSRWNQLATGMEWKGGQGSSMQFSVVDDGKRLSADWSCSELLQHKTPGKTH